MARSIWQFDILVIVEVAWSVAPAVGSPKQLRFNLRFGSRYLVWTIVKLFKLENADWTGSVTFPFHEATTSLAQPAGKLGYPDHENPPA
jgi:hypothetical protein